VRAVVGDGTQGTSSGAGAGGRGDSDTMRAWWRECCWGVEAVTVV
jgi:hypothetical protein